jgi:predicted ester cyclase
MDGHTEAADTVAALLAAWNARDLVRFTSFLTEDVYWHDLGMLHPPVVGREAVRAFSDTVLRAFPDFHFELRRPICLATDGSCCVVPWTISATNSGPYDPPGLAPTGRRLRFDGMDFIELRDGLVARIETRFDLIDVIEQMLGMSLRPAAGSWRERALVAVQRLVAGWVRWRRRRNEPAAAV